jgi:hypothetical protein
VYGGPKIFNLPPLLVVDLIDLVSIFSQITPLIIKSLAAKGLPVKLRRFAAGISNLNDMSWSQIHLTISFVL